MISPKRTKHNSSFPRQFPLSAEIIAGNPDILAEILTRLPLKSLLNFKCVSKHWLSIITDPQFRPNQRSNALSGLFLRRPLGLRNTAYDFINLGPDSCKPPFETLDFAPDPSGIRIMQSCNGLLLCCSFDPNQIQKTYYVYNPTTKQSTVLPAVNNPTKAVVGVILAFDPSKSSNYKVICVRIADSDLQFHYQIEIYSARSGSWRLSGSAFPTPYPMFEPNSSFFFFNGSVHWIPEDGDSLRFDLENEQIQEQPMPVVRGEEPYERLYRFIGESGGYLHLIEIYDSFSEPFDVYQMERDCSSWFPKFRVDPNRIAAVFPDMIQGYEEPADVSSLGFAILSVVRGAEDQDSYMVLYLPNKAIRYNFEDQSSYKLCDFEPIDEEVFEESLEEPVWYDPYPFIQSFALV